MVTVQQEPATTTVSNSVVRDVLEELRARKTTASPPEDPDLVDVQAAVACRYHTCRTALGVTREVRDRLADQETTAAKCVTFIQRKKIIKRTSTFVGSVIQGASRAGAGPPDTHF